MKKRQIMIWVAMGVMMAACSDNGLNEQTGWMENEALQLAASISETVQTRANEPASGTYYFSYVKNGAGNSTYSTTAVEFTNGDATPDLTWGGINKSSTYFILDNINNTTATYTSVPLDDDDDTFNAGPAPETAGEGNDLLWNTVLVKNVSSAPLSPVHFVLEHRMSMLTFAISSVNTEIDGLLKNGNVSVQLSNVVVKPTKFNRSNGTVSISTDKVDNITLEGAYVSSDTEAQGDYITKNWIFPPQKFDGDRPKLSITLERTIDGVTTKKTFKGVLPESMFYVDEYRSLEFLSGCHLTVTVVLGNWDNLEVNFRPVLVEKWDELKLANIVANQVGVYTADELEELVNSYNENPMNDNLTLWKYGVWNKQNQKWTFYLWKNLVGVQLNDPNSLGFKTSDGFTFVSSGHTINGMNVNENGTLSQKTTDGGE